MAIGGKVIIDLNRRKTSVARLVWNRMTPTRWAKTVSGQIADFAANGQVELRAHKDCLSLKTRERETPIFRSHAYASSLFLAGLTSIELQKGITAEKIKCILDTVCDNDLDQSKALLESKYLNVDISPASISSLHIAFKDIFSARFWLSIENISRLFIRIIPDPTDIFGPTIGAALTIASSFILSPVLLIASYITAHVDRKQLEVFIHSCAPSENESLKAAEILFATRKPDEIALLLSSLPPIKATSLCQAFIKSDNLGTTTYLNLAGAHNMDPKTSAQILNIYTPKGYKGFMVPAQGHMEERYVGSGYDVSLVPDWVEDIPSSPSRTEYSERDLQLASNIINQHSLDKRFSILKELNILNNDLAKHLQPLIVLS